MGGAGKTSSDIHFLAETKHRHAWVNDPHFRSVVESARREFTSRGALDVLLTGLAAAGKENRRTDG